jgi:maleylacetoacetate isomerase
VSLLTDETEQPDHLHRNPMGYVPVLEVTLPGSPAWFLGESTAILEWIEEVFPSPSLLPGNAFQRAKIRQLSQIINAGTQPLHNPNVTTLHSSDPAQQKLWNQTWIKKGLAAFEVVARDIPGVFSAGDSLTHADLCLIPQCYSALRNEIALSDFPRIEQIYTEAAKLESFQQSAPERFQPESS